MTHVHHVESFIRKLENFNVHCTKLEEEKGGGGGGGGGEFFVSIDEVLHYLKCFHSVPSLPKGEKQKKIYKFRK